MMLRRSAILFIVAMTLVTSAYKTREQTPTIRISRAWPVMGTMLTIEAWGSDSTTLTRAIHSARDSVRLVDSLMSLYRPESEINRINDAAGKSEVTVSRHMIQVLMSARRLFRLSNGLFDPTVAPLVRLWGFYDDNGQVPSASTIDSAKKLVGYERVEIDSIRHTVRLESKGMSVDLGGIAKGYALDLARLAFARQDVAGGMIDLGGNVLVFGRPPRGTKWVIGIRDPRNTRQLLGTVRIDSGAVATSGDYEHFFEINGVRYSHIIDPRSGYPSRGIIAASAIAPRGELSDGVSAALLLSGAGSGRAIAKFLGVAGIWIVDRSQRKIRKADIVLSPDASEMFRLH